MNRQEARVYRKREEERKQKFIVFFTFEKKSGREKRVCVCVYIYIFCKV